ncbi:MAG: hypothetical protein IPG23_11035 [Burkholderiales bacterium]|jgi:hypothetical protein|nr:hypothetical protein [Burkholderiales bacterium]
MYSAFYVVPIGGGDHVYASDSLSECMEMAVYFKRVEIVDMYGEVWRTTVDPRSSPAIVNYAASRATATGLFQRLRHSFSSTSI